jgi:hypothetical protein
LEDSIAKANDEKENIQTKLAEVQEESKMLKARLYAKFGNNIYLEEE